MQSAASLHPASTSKHPMMTVEGFSLWLDGFDTILTAQEPVQEIEARLLSQLNTPTRLLRWAIVKVENNHILCEGAYLKNSGNH
jgi:hypothetical protein